jgi:site-specific DNA recombinase
VTVVKKLSCCGIYTRKSTDHNLDLEFNSLDAQRESCEAYIKSQAQEGWRLIPDKFDDGAFSGASLDRPALQSLLADIEAGKIDTVVVYKVDRLTRSLADFAKLVELFDEKNVSFVSVTQSFNTTSSMGRLTLNVLLSFAQFEREVIGERVRDKISASKKKGLWVGGLVPLGYASVKKKIVVVPEEAQSVRTIFRHYLELGSVGGLIEDLDRLGITTKKRRLSNGRVVGGGRFGVGGLAHLLRNHFYIGEVVYRGETNPGEQEAILDRDLFEKVQQRLNHNTVARRTAMSSSSALLTGRLFDERGNRMTPSHSAKRGVRHRYYVCQAVLQRRKGEAGAVTRISAPEIESLVLNALRSRKSGEEASEPGAVTDRDLIEGQIDRVVIYPDSIQLFPKTNADDGEVLDGSGSEDANENASSPEPEVLKIPWAQKPFVLDKGITYEPSTREAMRPKARDALLQAIAKARRWVDDLSSGRISSLAEIAQREGRVERHIRLLSTLAFVSPNMIKKIMNGDAPVDLTVTGLAKSLPDSWDAQTQLFNS